MADCETCKEPIDADQPFYLIQSVRPGEEPENIYIGSMDCFVQWAGGMVGHFMVEHLLPEVLDADRAVQEAQEIERGDPSLN